MINYERKMIEETVEQVVPTSVTCNKCGKSQKLENKEHYENEWDLEAYPSFDTYFGYGSSWDGEAWQFNLCEDCLCEFVMSFEYAPAGWDTDNYLNSEHEQLRFEFVKDTGLHADTPIVDFVAEGKTDEEIMDILHSTTEDEIKRVREWYTNYLKKG